MSQYQALLHGRHTPGGDQISECSTWEDLATVISNAERDCIYGAGTLQTTLRGIGDHKDGLQLLASLLATLIPTESILSTLSLGIKLVLGVGRTLTSTNALQLTQIGCGANKCPT